MPYNQKYSSEITNGRILVLKKVNNTQRWNAAIDSVLPVIFAEIDMFDRLTFKAANSWLGYKTSKAMTHAMETLYRYD